MTTLVKQTFTAPNGTALTALTPDIGGGAWVIVEQAAGAAAPSIQSNGLKFFGNATYNATSVALTKSGGYGTSDEVASATVVYANQSQAEQHLDVRVDTSAGGFAKYSFGWFRGGSWVLRKHTALNGNDSSGTTQLAASAAAFPTGTHTLGLRAVTSGGVVYLLATLDGVVMFGGLVTDSTSPYLTGIGGLVGMNQSGDTPPGGTYATIFQVDTAPVGAADLTWVTKPNGATPGNAFGSQPVGTLTDSVGATVTGQADTITVSKVSGPGTLSGTLTASVNTATGQWAFTDLAVDTVGTYVLRFTSANGYSGLSASFAAANPTAVFAPSVINTPLTDEGWGAVLDGGCTLELRDGAVPTSVAASATGTVLATVTGAVKGTLQFPPFPSQFPRGGVATLVPPAMVTATATGTPTFLRVLKADGTPVMVVTCGASGRVVMNTSTITAGQRVQIETLWWDDAGQTISLATQVGGSIAIGGSMDGPAELPRVYIDSSYPDMTGANVYMVGPGQTYSDIKSAWNAAVRPARIILKNGADLTPLGGSGLNLGAKAGTGYVTIEAETMPCAEGVRASPTAMAAANAPKIRLDNANAAVYFGSNCHHVRLMGFEVLPAASSPPALSQWLINILPDNTQASNFGNGASYAELPHDITIDRCYVHGSSATDVKRGCQLDGNSIAVVDSYFSEIHHDDADANCFTSKLGQGPLKIVNNYVEATAENMLIGGSESPWGVVPSDIEVRYNTFQKPIAWKGVYFNLKTLVEFKCGVRVLIEGNDLLNNWEGNKGWYAPSFTFKTVNQNGGLQPWWRLSDVTVRHNRVQRSGGLVNYHPLPEGRKPATGAARLSIRNNLGAHMGEAPATGGGELRWMFALDGAPRMGATDVLFEHNTYVAPNLGGTFVQAGSTAALEHERVIIRNNVAATGANYPVNGEAMGYTDEVIAAFFAASSSFSKNVVSAGQTELGGPPVARGADNIWLTNTTDGTYPELHFTDLAGEDYSVTSASPAHAYATDGTDAGVNMTALLTALAGGTVSDPDPEPDPVLPLTYVPIVL